MVKTVAKLVTGCLIMMKSCYVYIRWLKSFLVSYEKDGTLSIYNVNNIYTLVLRNTSVNPPSPLRDNS